MGLMNAAGHYHNEITNNALTGIIYNIVELYIDDIFITRNESEDQHVEDVRQVLLVSGNPWKYGLKLTSKSVNYFLLIRICFDLSAITASVTSSIEENKIVKDSIIISKS